MSGMAQSGHARVTNQCPLLAQSGHGLVRCTCPLLGVKQTSERCPNVRTIVVSVQVRLRDLFIARVGDFTCHIGNGLRSNVPTSANNAKVPAMSGVARSVELYNSAYRLAWQKKSEGRKREQSDMAQRLHEYHRAPDQRGSKRRRSHCLRGTQRVDDPEQLVDRRGHDTQKIHPGSIR